MRAGGFDGDHVFQARSGAPGGGRRRAPSATGRCCPCKRTGPASALPSPMGSLFPILSYQASLSLSTNPDWHESRSAGSCTTRTFPPGRLVPAVPALPATDFNQSPTIPTDSTLEPCGRQPMRAAVTSDDAARAEHCSFKLRQLVAHLRGLLEFQVPRVLEHHLLEPLEFARRRFLAQAPRSGWPARRPSAILRPWLGVVDAVDHLLDLLDHAARGDAVLGG